MTDISKEQSSGDVLPTGFRDLDNILGGLHNSDFILLASRPEMGKTTLALEIAEYVASHENKKVLFFSLDLSKELLLHRLYNMEAGEVGLKEDTENLIIDDSLHMTVSEIRKKCCEYQAGLVVIDNLGGLSYNIFPHDHDLTDLNKDRYHEPFLVCQEIKQVAEDLCVPIILTSFVTRYDRQSIEKRPNLMYLQLRSQINQIADSVIFLYRDELYHEDSLYKGITEAIIAKQKNGSLGTVFLSWDSKHTKLVDLSEKQKEEVKKCQLIEKQDRYNLLGGDVKEEPYDGLEQTGCYLSDLSPDLRYKMIPGIRTGFDSFDKLTTGLHESDLILFAGCYEKLNTDLAAKIAFNISAKSEYVVYLTPSLRKRQDWMRRTGNLIVKEPARFDLSEISSSLRQLFSERKGIAIINSLQNICTKKEYGRDRQNQKIYEIMKSLKQLAAELNIPIIVFSGLYLFEKYRFGVKPKLSDIQGVYGIDQIPDLIAFIYNASFYTFDYIQSASEIIVEKQPYGPLGTAKFVYDNLTGEVVALSDL